MSSIAAGLTFHNHVIPLISKFTKSRDSQVTLSHMVTIGTGITEKCKFSVPLLDHNDMETICKCILKFNDVCHVTCLSLTQGPYKFTYFQQCLYGTTQDDWDLIATQFNQTNESFYHATTLFS